jgi:hypothetical protein
MDSSRLPVLIYDAEPHIVLGVLPQGERQNTPAKRDNKITKYVTEKALLNKLSNGQQYPDSIIQMCVADTRYVLPSGGEEWYELVGFHSQEKTGFNS